MPEIHGSDPVPCKPKSNVGYTATCSARIALTRPLRSLICAPGSDGFRARSSAGEHSPHTRGVAGSIPAAPTNSPKNYCEGTLAGDIVVPKQFLQFGSGDLVPRAILCQPLQLRPIVFIFALIASSQLPATDAILAAAALSSLAVGRNLGIFRPAPAWRGFDCPLPHGTVLHACSHGQFFRCHASFLASSGIFPVAIEPRIPTLNENGLITALNALIYLAECSAATAGPVGNGTPSARRQRCTRM